MILCAALFIENKETHIREVLPCRRHGDGVNFFYATDLNDAWEIKKEGFIDTENNFYDREDAYQHALMCGQLSASTKELKHEHHEIELYSEDLY